jgi:MoaA/NifB/PqqE/SkfB family radical SAM enzyme
MNSHTDLSHLLEPPSISRSLSADKFMPNSRKNPIPAEVSLDLALTSRCPLSCRYCTVEKAPTRELTSRKWNEVIRSIAGLKSIELISLEGGEPFLREDLPEILASALRHARRVKIVTGGSVPSRLPDSLVFDPRFHFEVSLDGPAPIHNFLRDQSYPQAFHFLRACLRAGIRVRFRTVISRHNLPHYETWLEELDRFIERGKEKIGFFFDTIITPRALSGRGGSIRRASLRDFPADVLVPSPLEIQGLFRRIRSRKFQNLRFLQNEPFRGCRAGESPSISFDPAGIYSFCCESPNGIGSIRDHPPEVCLSLLDEAFQNLPCRTCSCYGDEICLGCWTGQKCGMVGHWGVAHCRELVTIMVGQKFPLASKEKGLFPGERPLGMQSS